MKIENHCEIPFIDRSLGIQIRNVQLVKICIDFSTRVKNIILLLISG